MQKSKAAKDELDLDSIHPATEAASARGNIKRRAFMGLLAVTPPRQSQFVISKN